MQGAGFHAGRWTIPAVGLLAAVTLGPAGTAMAEKGAGIPRPAAAVARVLAPPGSPSDGAAQMAARIPVASGEAQALAETGTLADQRYPWIFPRSEKDRPDERSGRLLHVVYLVPKDAPDDLYDQKGFVEDSIRSMNSWFLKQTGNQTWRLDTFTFPWDDPATSEVEQIPTNAVDVTFVHSSNPSGGLTSVSTVKTDLIAHGMNAANKRYLTYVASNAGGVCGDALYPLDPTPSPVDGQYADVYLYSSSGCRARDFATSATEPSFTETIAMQEMIHNDAMVPLPAPHDCLISPLAFGHVCTGPLWATGLDPEQTDVMYPYVGLPLNQKFLDTDHLDYYRHLFPYRDLEQGLYLETA